MKPFRSKKAFGGALATATTVLLMTSFVVETEAERFREAERATVLQKISTLRSQLEGIVNSRLLVVEGLVAYVSTHPDTTQAEFAAMAKIILDRNPGIRSTNLAKDSIISHIYPLLGNERALGLDVRTVPEQRAALERAIRERRSIVAGPTELVQGGVALINRIPIYALSPPSPTPSQATSTPESVLKEPQQDYYWGFASILIDADQIYRDSGLITLTEQLKVTLRGKDALGAQGEVFFGSSEIFQEDPVTLMVTLPNGFWQIAATPQEGWSQQLPFLTTLWLVGVGVAGVSASYVFTLISEPDRLQRAVDQATWELAQILQQLQREMSEWQQAEEKLVESRHQLAMKETELAITHDLQQMLLPSLAFLESVSELEVSGFMEPAENVGGDYYDVIVLRDRIYIGIGDVTGHGLESGVVMLMVQAALRALLESETASAQDHINALNRMVCANTSRMGSPKQMTFALLEYRSGQLRFCGQHEEILILRGENHLEVVDTFDYGFPLGLEQDIQCFIAEQVLELQLEDVVLLYTDGVTEAMNAACQQYGRDRLCRVFQDCWGKSVQDIQATIVADIHRHVGAQPLADDLTLVVFQRKY
ncbi:MAG: SpoIIE family protein phosphatase [Prochlorothrix sp.]